MRLLAKESWGFLKEGFLSGGEISIIGVVRAPVAIINFALFVRGLLVESYRNSQIFTGIDAKLIIATIARTTPIIEIPPLTKAKNLLETPEKEGLGHLAIFYRRTHRNRSRIVTAIKNRLLALCTPPNP